MSALVYGSIAITLYLCASLFLWLPLRQRTAPNRLPLLVASVLAILFHGVTSYQWVVTESGLDFGLLPMSGAIFFTINAIVLISSLKKPLHNLFLGLFPATAALLLVTLVVEPGPALVQGISNELSLHIVFSVLAYSLLAIASCQAVLLAWQNWHLHNKQLNGWLQTHMPPLLTMEALLFELIWCGFTLLTLSLLTGILFVDGFFDHYLTHKTIFSIAAWAFYGVLLWGHHMRGWRGNLAIRLTLGGFSALVLSYTGSKFVMEVLLT